MLYKEKGKERGIDMGFTQRYSVFVIGFISYGLVLVFSIVFNIYNHAESVKALREQKRLYDIVMFGQFDEMIGGELQAAEAMLVNVLTDNDILKTVSARDLISSKELSQTLRASVKMRAHNKNTISSLYIYFNNNDAVIIDGLYYRSVDFYAQYVDNESISFEEWHKEQQREHFKDFGPAYSTNPNELALNHTINGRHPGINALVSIRIDLEPIFTIFKDSFFSGEMAFKIFGQDGLMLADYGGDYFNGADGMQIAPYTSERTGLTYQSAIPQSVYNSTLNDLLKRTVLMLTLELAVGLALCFWFARKNSLHMRELYMLLIRNEHPSPREKKPVKNEYKLISSRVETLLEQHRQVLKNNYLTNLLNNGLTDEESQSGYPRSLGLDFTGPVFQVADIRLKYINLPVTSGFEDIPLMKYHLTELIAGISAVHTEFIFASWNQVAAVFNGSASEWDTDSLCRKMEEVKNEFESRFGISLAIGLGGTHEELTGASVSYRESLVALEYSLLEGKGSVLAYNDINGRQPRNFFYPIIYKNQIKVKIHAGDDRGAAELLDKTFAGILDNREDLPLEAVKCLFFEIMGIGLEILAEIKIPGKSSNAEYMELLFGCESIIQLKDCFDKILTEICQLIKNGQGDRSRNLLERINTYIDEHCLESNFSLSGLAGFLSITPPYLSSFFKEKTGENLVDRVIERRIAEARRMLLFTNQNVADIAVAVGYTGSGTFIRSFKKLEGVTPAQYRKVGKLEPDSNSTALNRSLDVI
jgi:AraC-like DNA-binding protein